MQTKMRLNGKGWGGLRENAGRKRTCSKGTSHTRREVVSEKVPLHVNFKFRTSVRNKETLKLLKHAIQNARSHGLRVLHFSFQSNHVHLILEAATNEILTKGMRSLTITFSKGLKKGRVQIERYHLHVLKTLRETKNALSYVLFNQQKHESGIYSQIDDYSSLLSMSRGLDLIRKFAQDKNLTLKIQKGSGWKADLGFSFLIRRGTEQLFNQ